MTSIFRQSLRTFFRNQFAKIREINQKYATPRLKTSKGVKLALVILRFYLVFLILILIYKFYTLLV